MSPPPAATLLDRIAWRATSDPAGEAFVFAGRTWSYGELWDGIESVAARLLDVGVEPGARVIIAVPNGAEFFISFYGTQLCAAIAVPVSPDSGATRLANIARRCTANLVVASAPAVAAAVAQDTDLRVIDTSVPVESSSRSAFPVRDLDLDLGLDLGLDPQAVAYLQYTSGSTGEPKGVEITHANALTNVEQMIAGMEITEREVFVSWLPVHHDMGLVLMTMVPFYLGARLILLPTSLRDVRRWLSEIERCQGTFTAAPDFAYRLALRSIANKKAQYDLSSLRVALNAAEPVRAQTLKMFQQAFGLRNVMAPGYGLAESTVGVSMWRPGVAAKIDARGVPSVGRPFPGVEVEILGETSLLGPNEEGEIVVKSAANTSGYWQDPEASVDLFYERDYLRTGDLGYLDGDGDLFVVGRKKNIIIQAGRNIAPAEVEELIESFPFVRLSAAVGIDRGRYEGEQIYAFVELRSRQQFPRAEYRRMVIELTHYVRSQLGLGPGRLYLMAPRAIPLTHNGKVRHPELKSLYLDGTLRDQGSLLFPDY